MELCEADRSVFRFGKHKIHAVLAGNHYYTSIQSMARDLEVSEEYIQEIVTNNKKVKKGLVKLNKALYFDGFWEGEGDRDNYDDGEEGDRQYEAAKKWQKRWVARNAKKMRKALCLDSLDPKTKLLCDDAIFQLLVHCDSEIANQMKLEIVKLCIGRFIDLLDTVVSLERY